MALVDLSSKQSLLGLDSPISDMDENIGPQFARWRNTAHNIGPEPHLDEEGEIFNIIDTIGEKSLTKYYQYNYGSPYGESKVVLPPSNLDLYTDHEPYSNPEIPTLDI
jgi:hypothetical protein